ncbi:hypothetical protein Tco_0402581, partial [Tanacetum coccineum]
FVNAHQSVLLVFVLVDESSWIGVWCISVSSSQIRSVRVRLCEVEFLLIAFNTQLKVFHTPLDDNTSCEQNILKETLNAIRSSMLRFVIFPCTRRSSMSLMSWIRSLWKSPSLNL